MQHQKMRNMKTDRRGPLETSKVDCDSPGNDASAGARLAHPKPLFMLNPLLPRACCCCRGDRHDNLSAADDGIAHDGGATKALVEANAAAAHASKSNAPCMILLYCLWQKKEKKMEKAKLRGERTEPPRGYANPC